jgi:hypothetical protein
MGRESLLHALDEQLRTPSCQHCLADPLYTPLAHPGDPSCPVCGSAYGGSRRDAEYQALVDAGLVSRGE